MHCSSCLHADIVRPSGDQQYFVGPLKRTLLVAKYLKRLRLRVPGSVWSCVSVFIRVVSCDLSPAETVYDFGVQFCLLFQKDEHLLYNPTQFYERGEIADWM